MDSGLVTDSLLPAQIFQYHSAFGQAQPLGKVYYGEYHAGYITETAGGGTVFQYAKDYLAEGGIAIAHTLPLAQKPYITQGGLIPFFDNLVAEGWLEQKQTEMLGKRYASRFELLLAFGADCAGAVSVENVTPNLHLGDSAPHYASRKKKSRLSSASLSGVQPKFATIKNKDGSYRLAEIGEISTHIAKFSSPRHEGMIVNECITTKATAALLPHDKVIDCVLGKVKSMPDSALIITRFDRDGAGKRIHFEEFNQLLELPSQAKDSGSYKDMADFIRKNGANPKTQIYVLFQRILAGILLGNTDMHLKNFAMFHDPDNQHGGMRLTPGYDLVAARLYEYKYLALPFAGRGDPTTALLQIAPRHIWALGDYFHLPKRTIQIAVQRLGKNIAAAKKAIATATPDNDTLKSQLTKLMEKLWNQAFKPIGND